MSADYHSITNTPGGAECSCGRVFSVWHTRRKSGWFTAHDANRTINLMRANANRHAEAANRVRWVVCEETVDGSPSGRFYVQDVRLGYCTEPTTRRKAESEARRRNADHR